MTNPQIVLVRHASATGQEAGAALTADGVQQAVSLAAVLVALGVTRVVSSPFTRAVQTVQPFCDRAGVSLETDVRLVERTLSARALPDWRDHLRRSFGDPDYALDDGESGLQAQARGVAVLHEAAAQGAPCALVTHGNLLALMLASIDPAFGYDAWLALSNPDVFVVDTSAGRATSFRRLLR